MKAPGSSLWVPQLRGSFEILHLEGLSFSKIVQPCLSGQVGRKVNGGSGPTGKSAVHQRMHVARDSCWDHGAQRALHKRPGNMDEQAGI